MNLSRLQAADELTEERDVAVDEIVASARGGARDPGGLGRRRGRARRRARALRARRRAGAQRGRRQPHRQRDRLLAEGLERRRRGEGSSTASSRSPSPTAASASPRATRSACSSGSTAPTRRARAAPAAPASASSIVKHAVQRHGGEVRLWSRPGPRLDLHDPPPADRRPRRPAAAQAQAPQEEAATPAPASRAVPTNGDTRMTRVLIVEDEPDLADPLAYLLRREGYEVEIAEDGPAALDGLPRARRRHHPARPHAARDVGHRGVPADPRRPRACRSSC